MFIRQLKTKTHLLVGAVALAGLFALASCNKNKFNPELYDLNLNAVYGVKDQAGDIISYPCLNVRIIGPSASARWQLTASIPGEEPKTFSLLEGSQYKLELDFAAFKKKKRQEDNVTVIIKKISTGDLLFEDTIYVTFEDGVPD